MGSLFWAEQFDEKFTDIFAFEDALSERVASALSLRLSGSEATRIQQRYTDNIEAYQSYLRGRYQMNLAAEGALKALDSFQDAVQKDPKFALAGRRKEALDMLGQLLEAKKHEYVSMFAISQIYAALGDKDQAFAWLNKAVDEREVVVVFLKGMRGSVPSMANLRDDPRFELLLRRMGLAS